MLRAFLSNRTLLSPDALLAISFGGEALAFLLIGFFVSFLARGFGAREMGLAALLLAIAAFIALRQLKPPSFSYDRFFASTEELILWAAFTGAGAWLLGMWGASAGVLLGAAGTPDLRFGYEAGIARTHLRLNRRTALTLIALDGTWWQARKLLNLNPGLAALPRVAFTPRRLSDYRIRRQPAATTRTTRRNPVFRLRV